MENTQQTPRQQHDNTQRAARLVALAGIRAELKKRRISQRDLSLSCGSSLSWVGTVLRGGYPFTGSGCLTHALQRALTGRGVAVPACLLSGHAPYQAAVAPAEPLALPA